MFSRQYYLHPQLFWTVTNSFGDKFYVVVSCQNFHCCPWIAHSCIVLIRFTPTMTSPDLTSLLWHTATYQGLSKVDFSSSFLSSQSQLSIPKLWPLIGGKVKAKEKQTTEGRTCLNTGLVFTNDIECLLRPWQWFGEKQKPENQVFLCSSIAQCATPSIIINFCTLYSQFREVVKINLWKPTLCQHSFHG